MTTVEANAARIFEDAHRMGDAALELLASGDIRVAAEKAWCATLRATEALVLARTGQEPGSPIEAGRRLRAVAMSDQTLCELRGRYFYRQAVIHDECLCQDCCQPALLERLIRETADYISNAERLARG